MAFGLSHADLNKFAETFRSCAGSKGYLEKGDFVKMVACKSKKCDASTFLT